MPNRIQWNQKGYLHVQLNVFSTQHINFLSHLPFRSVWISYEEAHEVVFSNAARTITALTVMRSGRKLRNLDNVGSHSNQHKHKTQPKTNKSKNHRQKKASQKARTKVKRGETCGNATLKLSRVLLQEIVPNNTSSYPKL